MTDEEPGFVTAADLYEAEAAERTSADDRTPGAETFTIPEWPVRKYPRSGGVEYVGGTVFSLVPDTPVDERPGDEALTALVESVLEGEAYRWGDWLDLPMPLYLVHDDETHDTFRVGVRDGRIELHVLPETESAGLRALYERLCEAADWDEWTVERRTNEPV